MTSLSVSTISRGALLAVILLIFSLASPDFLRVQNVYALFQATSLLGLVALGLTLTMIAGEFDLSVGAMVAASGIITLKLADHGVAVAILSALAFGIVIGLFNAGVTASMRISSLVVTVGTMMGLSGFASWLADGKAVTIDNFLPSEMLDDPVGAIFSLRSLITLGAFFGLAAMIRTTRAGRDIIATGSYRAVAAASGVRLGLSLALVFAISGACAALAGSLLSLSLATATPTMGASLLLQAVSAAILGGVALTGGVGRPMGALLGTLILAALNNGLGVLGTSTAGILLANGVVLLLVVLIEGRPGAMLLQHLRGRAPSPASLHA